MFHKGPVAANGANIVQNLYYGKCTGKRDFTLFISAKHVQKLEISHCRKN
jgi:hypothetical protein